MDGLVEAFVVAVLVQLFVFGYFGFWVAGQCGRNPLEGYILGALFGPIGVIVEALLPKFPYEKHVRDASANRY